jgi:predicted nucleic acid-binding protein
MNAVFADTSFCIAICNPHDALHDRAKAIAAALIGKIITTEFVLVEVGNFFCRGNGRAVFQTLIENLSTAEDIEIIPASSDCFRKGLGLFTSRPDKDWSLTDCTSFVVMQERAVTEALSADHHFEQAGFVALLK